MTDLTDKWKKGEFIICNAGKCQYYYVQNEEQREVIKTEYCLFDDNTPNWQILALVPSYNEWQAKLEENAQLKKWCEEFNALEVAKENAQLKELLKECQNMIAFKHEVYEEDALIKEIDEVLGEKEC